MTLETAFPGHIYGKYKRTTRFFLDWIWRGHSASSACSVHDSASVHELDDVVTELVTQPTSLRPQLRKELPLALAASSGHHASTSDADGVDKEFEIDFSNYYEVLVIPDDFFPEVDTVDPDEETKTPSPSEAERKHLFDEAFAHNLKMDVSFFLMELEELSDAVYKVYCDVKHEKRTLIEASVVVKVAIQCATSAVARFQLRYPSVQNAKDMILLMGDYVSNSVASSIYAQVMKEWIERLRDRGRMESVPGAIIVDFTWVARTLTSFGNHLPHDPKCDHGLSWYRNTFGQAVQLRRNAALCDARANFVAGVSFPSTPCVVQRADCLSTVWVAPSLTRKIRFVAFLESFKELFST